MQNDQNFRSFRIVTWDQVRNDVLAVEPELAKIIDAVNPNKEFKLIEACYAYGDLIVKNGLAQLPTSQGLIPITSPELSTEVKELLSYSSIPLFLTLENDNEVFVDIHTRIVPLNLFHAGSLLGVFETADFIFGRESAAKWSVSAGSRSIFALPKINDNLGLKRLRSHYDFENTLRANSLFDHFHLFSAIANSKHFKQSWHNRVLFFSREWLKEVDNLELITLQKYILKQGWLQASSVINRIELGLQSEKFTEIVSLRNLKPRPFIIDNARHLLYIIAGSLPAFRSMDDSQYAAPTGELQQALIEIYHIETHYPTIMHVCSLNDIKRFPVYYSLSYPTLLDGSPINPSTSTIMLDLKEIKFLFDTLQKRGVNSEFIQHIINNVEINYFHTEQDEDTKIKLSTQIPKEDCSFILANNKYNLGFCYSSKFWKGCIRIKFKS